MTIKYAILFLEYGFGDGMVCDTLQEAKRWAANKYHAVKTNINDRYVFAFTQAGYRPLFSLVKLQYDERVMAPEIRYYDGAPQVIYVPTCPHSNMDHIVTGALDAVNEYEEADNVE